MGKINENIFLVTLPVYLSCVLIAFFTVASLEKIAILELTKTKYKEQVKSITKDRQQ